MLRQKLLSRNVQWYVRKRYLHAHDTFLEIHLDQVQPSKKFHYFWLRDHCRCLQCYNHKSHQVNINILDLPKDIKPISCQKENDKLQIKWNDEHFSEYSFDFLKSVDFPTRKCREMVFWNKDIVRNIKDAYVPVKELNEPNIGVKKLLKSILTYGFGFVTGVDTTMKATEELVEKVGPVQNTLFGGMWGVTNDYLHDDTAYTNVSLGPHTDNTYFTEAGGIQIFHLLSHDGEGGESVLVDGFNVATEFKKRNPTGFEFLQTYPVTSEYIEEGYHYSSTDFVIKTNAVTQSLQQIRFNIYDRAVLDTIPQEKIAEFYEHYTDFAREVSEDEHQWWFKLEPGSVVFIDNWRVMHGRASYNGIRSLCGCYISRSEWLSKAQSLKLNIL